MNTVSYRHRHRVLTAKSSDKGQAWNSWPTDDKLHIGLYLVDLVLAHTPLFTRVTNTQNQKSTTNIRISDEAQKWILNDNETRSMLMPVFLPLIIPPKDWSGMYDGGYYSPVIQSRSPFIKRSRKSNFRLAERAVQSGAASEIMRGVNEIQRTAWRVNTDVLDTITYVYENSLGVGIPSSEPINTDDPFLYNGESINMKREDMTEDMKAAFSEWCKERVALYTAERERVAQGLRFIRAIEVATRFRDYESIWFTYNCDFRGRIYAAGTGLSPQGADESKGMLQFAEGKAITDRGGYWLAVHGANTYGEDKLTLDGRAAWVHENSERIVALGRDPKSNLSFLRGADKPWQFLAFALEWAQYHDSGFSPEFKTRIPIAMDGSCNGIQHYSALLKDPVGARSVNLTPSDTPADIYRDVSDVCSHKVKLFDAEADDRLNFWKNVSIDRALAKKPVMTLPYGSTRITCTDSIIEWLKDNTDVNTAGARNSLAHGLTPLLWASIGDVVLAARVGMAWLQSLARACVRGTSDVFYYTPLGFPVSHSVNTINTKTIDTQLCGRWKLNIAYDTDALDSARMANGIAPHFIHSMDATHLLMTVPRSEQGTSWGMVHGSFSTHACLSLIHI